MASENIKFSILVPVYNTEEYLHACVQSVLQQTYKNYELILVNDGSKDSSGEIIDRYAQMYDNIFAYHKENAGQLHTREYAIERATGDYCIFLDSDDTLRENALEIINGKIAEYGCDCVIYQMEQVREGKVLSPAPNFADFCISDKRELYKKCCLSNEYNSMCRKAVKIDVFLEKEDYSSDYALRLGEDMIQSLSVLKKSNKVIFIDDVLYNYTVNPKSVTHTMLDNLNSSDFLCYQRVLAFLENEGVWNEQDFLEILNHYAHWLCGILITVCNEDLPVKKKRKILQEVRRTGLYQRHLSRISHTKLSLGKRKHIFFLFRRNMDMFLITFVRLFRRRLNKR